MKKIIVAFMALTGVVSADYIWQGGSTITSDGWKNSANWNLTGEKEFSGLGPGITGSEMWDDIYVSSASGTVGNESEFTLEGWSLDLHLSDSANLTFRNIRKFQGGANIDIDATSSLTIYSFYGGNDGGSINLNNKGSFTLGYSMRTQGGDGFKMNLFDTGIVTLQAQNTDGTNTAKVASITAILAGTESGIQERVLVDKKEGVSFDDTQTTYTFTDVNGVAMTAVDSLDALANATAPSYYVEKNDAGIKVYYGSLIPEPTTATLSLLALVGLATRRRRK